MSVIGIVKPVYMMRAIMIIEAGAMAWAIVREAAPIVRNIIDIVRVHTNEKSKKMKKFSGVRRKSHKIED